MTYSSILCLDSTCFVSALIVFLFPDRPRLEILCTNAEFVYGTKVSREMGDVSHVIHIHTFSAHDWPEILVTDVDAIPQPSSLPDVPLAKEDLLLKSVSPVEPDQHQSGKRVTFKARPKIPLKIHHATQII